MKKGILSLLASALLVACSSDDQATVTEPTADFRPGYWVLNEGGFGTLDYLSLDLNRHQRDVFTQVNGLSQDLGQYAQSVFFAGDKAYVVSNGSNKITVLNRDTMEYVTTISGDLVVPRYGVVVGNYAYVTNANTFASVTDDFVSKINLTTNEIESRIAVNNISERILAHNGKLYITDGFYGAGDGVVVLDLATGAQTEIVTNQAPSSIQTDGTYLYVLTGDYVQTYSQLFKYRLSDHQLVAQSNLGDNSANATNLVLADSKLYFNVGRSVYRYEASTLTNLSTAAFLEVATASNFAGYGFNVLNGHIFVGNSANDFSSDGELKIYDTAGNLVKELTTGVGPNGIYLNQ